MAKKSEYEVSRTGLEIAVIGMSGRFPGARNIKEFWINLKNGIESIYFFSEQESEKAGTPPENLADSNFVRARGIIENIEYFDAEFFDYTPQEAEIMDPQMRTFHECSWEALEDAGYSPESYNGRVGVYGGSSTSYYWLAFSQFSKTTALMGNIASVTLYNKDFLCKRISYNFNLKGPSFSLYTACSTSLVAVDLACKGLLTGQCDIALAGGVSIKDPRKNGYQYSPGMIVSPDGHNRTFDRKAGGTVFGNGAGVVVLKPLEDAEREGDSIYAVIKGSAVNNDGISKSNFAAPSLEGQVEVIRTALHLAEVEPETIGYIEAHGTATEVGDPIEIEGLKRAFNTGEKGYCAVGSVKSNVGHLDCAAGVAGFIKTVLSLKNKLIPPSLHFESANAEIEFENSPFFVNVIPRKWKRDLYPLRAGVSAFGIGGTNAHVVLEEWSDRIPLDKATGETDNRSFQLIPLSAKSPAALEQIAINLSEHLDQTPDISIADVAYTLQRGRTAFGQRRYVVCSTVENTITSLKTPGTESNIKSLQDIDAKRPIIFMFPGQGSQYINMGLDLYETEKVFRKEMDRCFDIIQSLIGYDIKAILYPEQTGKNSEEINRTDIAQPLLFSFEYSLAKLLIHWGIKPKSMIGYSLGEYAAACISGVLSLEDALGIIVIRGELMQTLPTGAMLSVPLPREELAPILNMGIDTYSEMNLAIDNGPSCIVSGSIESIDLLEENLKKKRIMCMRVPVSYAFHSKMMEPVKERFTAAISHLSFKKQDIPYISNVTGTWITETQNKNPDYWAVHLTHSVKYADGVKELLKISKGIFIEVGPGRDLTALISRYIEDSPDRLALDLVPVENRQISDIRYLFDRIGKLWLNGIKIDWAAFNGEENRHRIHLPTYPFKGQLYPVEGDFLNKGAELFSTAGVQLKKKDISQCFYLPTWIRKDLLIPGGIKTENDRKCCLVFLEEGNGIGTLLVEKLRQNGHKVIPIMVGEDYINDIDGSFKINPQQSGDYIKFFQEVVGLEYSAFFIIHLWGVDFSTKEKSFESSDAVMDMERIRELQEIGFYSLINIAKAIEKENKSSRFKINIVTTGMQEITGEEELCPGKATVLGPAKVIPQENPAIRCQSIDIWQSNMGNWNEDLLVNQLMQEVLSISTDNVVAYRGKFRWIQTFEPIHLDKNLEIDTDSSLKENGVYLITGGLGNIGLIVAKHLAKKAKAKLILTGRSIIPPREEWGRLEIENSDRNSLIEKIKRIREIEDAGGEVMAVAADTADLKQMQNIIFRAEQKFGPINGVIHAAGLVKGRSINTIQNLGKSDCQAQFKPKVEGVLVLERLFKDKKLDFLWLISSISAVLGGLELAAYAAANAFMDAFVKKYNRESSKKWKSVDWEGKEPEEVRRGFDLILQVDNIDQIVFARGGTLQERINRWIKLEIPEEDENKSEELEDYLPQRRSRPSLLSNYVAPRNETEKKLVKIWETLFGFENLGVNDDFIELGGDSLKAVQIITRINKEFEVSVPLVDFFKEPTIEHLSKYIVTTEQESYRSISPVEKKEYYSMSAAQKRIYIIHQMNPDSMGYNLGSTLLLQGEIDMVLLEESLKKLIARHESLRTSFHFVDNQPVQRVHHWMEFEFKIKCWEIGVPRPGPDANPTGEEESPVRSHRLIENRIHAFIEPFDLSQAPLLRVGLIQLTKKEHILIIDMHHIIHDGVSQVVFLKDLNALYSGEELPILKIQYKDFAQWQNGNVIGEEVRKQEKYWCNRFEGEIPLLNLATDYARPAVQKQTGKVVRFTLNTQLTSALRELAVKNETTSFTLLLAIFLTLLARLSGQEDIVVGTPIASRRHQDIQSIIGFFLNTLALRHYPLSDKFFIEFLKEIKEKTLKDFDNQDYPFEDLVEKVGVKRDLSRNPLFDVMFIWHNQWDVSPGEISLQSIGDLTLKPYLLEKETSEFDLTLIGNEIENRIEFKFEYCTKLFKKSTIQRFVRYLQELVSSVVKNPEKKIADLDMIPPEEKERVLYGFNRTTFEYAQRETIHQLFRIQEELKPDSTALVGKANDTFQLHLSYRELGKKSSHLASNLKKRGIRSNTIVALMVERSIQMVVGMLGILQAGGAYLPLDPMHPAARIKYILQKSHTRLLVTSTRKRELSLPDFNGEIIDINDEDGEALEDYTKNEMINKSWPGKSSDLAYVIFTSGSTGNPKGVMITHNNVVNFFSGMIREIGFSSGKFILALTTISFDISVLELLLPLVTGMKVFVAGEEEQTDPLLLIESLLKNKVEVMQITPSHLKLVLSIPQRENFLRYIGTLLVGGEAFPQHLFEAVAGNFDGTVYNMYGPTETTIWSTIGPLKSGDTVNIGYPIVNTQIFILNRLNRVQPIGVSGELCIGGDGVSRGYLNNPILTAEKFVIFSLKSQCASQSNCSIKIYRTGDLARWLPIGEIEFLGRLDHQVKIRGFRIELEEIQEQLLHCEGVTEVLAVSDIDESGDGFISAYIVSNKEVEIDKMREFLLPKLPVYMIPSYFIQVDKIPLTPNGKVDRKALPSPKGRSTKLGTTYLAPTTEMEKTIAEVWKEILNIEEVGIHDSFFALGGNSLNIVQLNSRLKEIMQVDIPVVSMFRYFTINSLIKYITDLNGDRSKARSNNRTQQIDSLKQSAKTYKNSIRQFKKGAKNGRAQY